MVARARRVACGLAALVVCAPWPALARAHGGFPESLELSFASPEDEAPLVLTSFGLLAEQDGRWAWVCEEIAGADGVATALALPDAWLLATTSGLLRSADGCDWARPTALEGQYVTALWADRLSADTVWATTHLEGGDGGLYRSTDGGQSFEAAGEWGAGASLRGVRQGADGALVVVGWVEGAAWLWRSADGQDWTGVALPVSAEASLGLLAVDGEGAAWVRASTSATDQLGRVATDGTFTEIGSFDDTILAFDAGPAPGQLLLSLSAAGLRASTDDGQTWSEADDSPTPKCLITQGDRRYACTHNWSDEAAVAWTDAAGSDPGAMTWTPVLWFGDVHEPLDCPASSATATTCEPLWETVVASSGMDLERAADDSGADADKGPGSCGCAATSSSGAGAWLMAVALVWARRRFATRPDGQ